MSEAMFACLTLKQRMAVDPAVWWSPPPELVKCACITWFHENLPVLPWGVAEVVTGKHARGLHRVSRPFRVDAHRPKQMGPMSAP